MKHIITKEEHIFEWNKFTTLKTKSALTQGKVLWVSKDCSADKLNKQKNRFGAGVGNLNLDEW